VYDDTIYNFCARARFAGCSYLRHIILGLNTVHRLAESIPWRIHSWAPETFTNSGSAFRSGMHYTQKKYRV
jgi:hypothetical protein